MMKKIKRIMIISLITVFLGSIASVGILKTGFIGNIYLASKMLGSKYLPVNITDEVSERLKVLGFKNKLKEDITFSAFYSLSTHQRLGSYDKNLNSFFISDVKERYNKGKIKENILNGKHDSVIVHEYLHYLLTNKELKEKIYKLQTEDLNLSLDYFLNPNIYETNNPEKKERLDGSLISTIDILLVGKIYNKYGITRDYLLSEISKNSTDKKVEHIREEMIVYKMEYIFKLGNMVAPSKQSIEVQRLLLFNQKRMPLL